MTSSARAGSDKVIAIDEVFLCSACVYDALSRSGDSGAGMRQLSNSQSV